MWEVVVVDGGYYGEAVDGGVVGVGVGGGGGGEGVAAVVVVVGDGGGEALAGEVSHWPGVEGTAVIG